MTLKKTTSETGTHSPVADILNTVSGAYCSEFWDGVYEVSGTLNSVTPVVFCGSPYFFELLFSSYVPPTVPSPPIKVRVFPSTVNSYSESRTDSLA